LESRTADQVIHLAIEVTSSADPLPARRQSMLPPSNPDFQGQAVFDEKQPTSPFQNPSHLRKSLDRVRGRAHKVHVITIASKVASANRIASADALISEDRNDGVRRPLPRETQQIARGIDPDRATPIA